MSTPATEAPTQPAPTASPAQEPPKPAPPAEPPKADIDWTAEARKWEARAKENKAAADRLAALEEAQKSEAEKQADRVAKAEKAAAEANRELLRYRVAAAKGVDPELLAGDDEAAMTAHADRLIAWRGDQKPAGPRPDPSQGARQGAASKAADGVAEARKRFGKSAGQQ